MHFLLFFRFLAFIPVRHHRPTCEPLLAGGNGGVGFVLDKTTNNAANDTNWRQMTPMPTSTMNNANANNEQRQRQYQCQCQCQRQRTPRHHPTNEPLLVGGMVMLMLMPMGMRGRHRNGRMNNQHERGRPRNMDNIQQRHGEQRRPTTRSNTTTTTTIPCHVLTQCPTLATNVRWWGSFFFYLSNGHFPLLCMGEGFLSLFFLYFC